MKKVLCIALSLAVCLSMLTSISFAYTSIDNAISYDELDYSAELSITQSRSGVMFDNDYFANVVYSSSGDDWKGNVYGYTANLTGGRTYEISYYVENADGSDDNLQPNIFVFKNTLTGNSVNDLVSGGDGTSQIDGNGIFTRKVTPTVSGTNPYKIMLMCFMYSSAIKYKVTLIDITNMPESTSFGNERSYTNLNYGNEVKVDGLPLMANMYSNAPSVETEYWSGNALGANAYLYSGHTYEIWFDTYFPDDKIAENQSIIILLTNDDFNGEDYYFNDDVLAYSEGMFGEKNHQTTSIKFTPTETGIYPLLAICWFDNENITYEISVIEVEYEPNSDTEIETDTDTDYYTDTVDNESDTEYQTDFSNCVSYTELDYSKKYGESTSYGIIKYDSVSVDTQYWYGNAVAYSADLEKDHLYKIKFTVFSTDENEVETETCLILLTNGEFKGKDNDFNDDDITYNGMTKTSTRCETSVSFVPDETGTYRILGISNIYTKEVNFELSVEECGEVTAYELPKLEYKWKSEYNNNGMGTLAISSKGETAIADTYGEYDSDSDKFEQQFYIRVYNNDGSLKFKSKMPYKTDATPVFDEDGNVYIATDAKYYIPIGYDSDSDEILYANPTSFVTAYSSDGEKLWETEFESGDSDDDYDFYSTLYICDDILVAKAQSAIFGLNKNDGSVVWAIEDIDCYVDYQRTGFTVSDGMIYLALWGENEIKQGSKEYYLNAPIIVIDAKTGEIVKAYDEITNGGYKDGATASTLCVKDGYLYFLALGGYKDESGTLICPFYSINLETDEIVRIPTGLNGTSYMLVSALSDDEIFVTDNNGNNYVVLVNNGEVTSGFPVSLDELIIDDEKYNALKVDGQIITREDIADAIIYDIYLDSDNNAYFMVEFDTVLGHYIGCILKNEVSYNDAGDVSYTMKILNVIDIYNQRFVADKDNLYFSTYVGPIYAISLGESQGTGFVKGDINQDGILDILDVVIARAHIVGNKILDDEAIKRGDMNGDGLLDIIDVAMMRKYIVDKK